MEAFIRRIPKAELHVHIEGTLEPEMMFELARKHRLRLPYDSIEQLRQAYSFSNLQSFLDLYYQGAEVLRDEGDFHALTSAYLRRAHADGVVHAEIFFDPQTHTARGVPLASVIGGMQNALKEAQQELGITHRLILCFLRHLSAQDAMTMLEQALPHIGAIAAVGLDSSEAGHAPSKFAAVFARARSEGLLAVAHAGEEGPPEYVSEALDLLQVKRVDHGVRSEEDPALLARLTRDRVPLTMCPLSNVRLRVFKRMEDHSLKRLLRQGLCVTVNSDDPAYFGGYVVANYLAAVRALALTRADIVQLANNSFEASFLPQGEKEAWLAKVRNFNADAPSASV
ncbi:MAG: adenosine deaminase [Sinobacteraceae bacterium]|nr:adenosine deaminase [Nevskiaceae bacterium]